MQREISGILISLFVVVIIVVDPAVVGWVSLVSIVLRIFWYDLTHGASRG